MSKKSKHSKGKKNKGSYSKKSLMNKVMGIFSHQPQKTFNYKQISKILSLKDTSSRQLVVKILEELALSKNIEEIQRGTYKLKSKSGYIQGTVDLTSNGYAYIICDQLDEDVFVSQKNLNRALDGDTVKIYIYARKKRGQPEGEVVEVVKRARNQFVGVVELSEKFAFLIPDNKKMPYDIFIPLKQTKNIKNGQKAIVKITDWPQKAKNPLGEIIEVLGNPGDNETEMHAILAEFGLPYKFPKNIEKVAATISDKISKEEIKKRKDLRNTDTFTIDPADAKDFDDAISIKKIDNNKWEIGIHIADVTHYIKSGEILDKEAYERATSVYLVDRVVPMLPEKLSNHVCSLRPDEDKLCFSAVFKIDRNAIVSDEWFGKTVIKSNRRFNYDEVQEIINNEKGDYAKEIKILNNIAQKLRKKRFDNGAINLERTEVSFDIDKKGKPLGVIVNEQNESHQLIEEFMLLANRHVAELFKDINDTFVYRIHDRPNEEKLQSFNNFIKKFGHHLEFNNKESLAVSINNILDNVKGKKEQDLIENLILRSMAKAKYSSKNIGHYGLSFKHYTHFTSPIRRYPDVMVHRMLEKYLNGETIGKSKKTEKKCQHCSEKEQKATEAERASIKYKQVEFMSDKLGEEYEGVISGVTQKGLFIELTENLCEGFVSISEIFDDFYEYDEDNFCIRGRNKKKKYQMGDIVQVKIVKTNLEKRQIDLFLAEK